MKQFLALILLAALMLTGCGAPAAPAGTTAPESSAASTAASDPDTAVSAVPVLTFTDDLDRTVSLPAVPQRAACLLGSYADVWTLAGGTCIAAPDDAWDDYHLELPDDAVNLGGTKHLSLEAILAAEPDFIIASSNSKSHLEWKDTLEASGIPVAYFKVTGFGDYLHMLRTLTDLTGNPAAFEACGTDVSAQIDAAIADSEARLASAEPEKILHMRMSASGLRVKNSKGNILGEIAADLGCINIADSDDSLLENLSMEHILLQDPDWILLVQQGDDVEGAQAVLDRFIAENPAWQELSAVKNDRVRILDKRLFSLKPNALWGQAYTELEQLLCEAE